MRVESKEQWYQYQSHITDLMLCHITSTDDLMDLPDIEQRLLI